MYYVCRTERRFAISDAGRTAGNCAWQYNHIRERWEISALCKEIILDGAGALYERFEALKQELGEMGMFAEEYKQPIPKFARTIGVVTAPTGAAIRDIINVAGRRNPYVQLLLYPALVQGEGAAASIVEGIAALEKKRSRFDHCRARRWFYRRSLGV